jgi:hypothetical protein
MTTRATRTLKTNKGVFNKARGAYNKYTPAKRTPVSISTAGY